ncbi:post-GPI attachment to proteins factor 6 [Synchiropus splendidus]|uniref:post-GPI attachment to proteins factor 6 n=1 Tax=Synchiropus splendidus TaxID=270530 RepID=UPI00237E9339|nr:post-GPI attachment to proteins factor 6 [Synchiropus splendidus]
MELFCLCVLFSVALASTLAADGQVTFVSELSSKPAQRLSKYGWYGNVRLQRFHVPEDTAIARWVFLAAKSQGFNCGQHKVFIHLRAGAPPVINPLGLVFPNTTQWTPCLNLTLSVTSQSSTTFNLSYPTPGDWFVAAHLPEDDGRIEQKGFPSCTYFFQPLLSIRRAVDTPVLQKNVALQQIASPVAPARLKFYVPEFASSLSVSVSNCVSVEKPAGGSCLLVLRLGSDSLTEGLMSVNCTGLSCSAVLPNPPWGTWLRVVVESSQEARTVEFNVLSDYTVGCKPESLGLAADDDLNKLRRSSSLSNSTVAANSSFVAANESAPLQPSSCIWNIPVLDEQLDVLSHKFTPVQGPKVSVTSTHPTLLMYPLHAQSTGGSLNLKLTLNTTNVTLANSSSVVACFSPRVPVLLLDQPDSCPSGLFGGFGVSINSSSPTAVFHVPFPESTTWYLSLQLLCSRGDCGDVPVVSVVPEVSISACVDSCGANGECTLLRSFSYVYASCVCKAGWSGWGCTDATNAQSYAHQVFATLLLTLSNLCFLPAIVVAAHRLYFTEASVYLFTMFFSTFYHACDQPGVAVMCIMDYDALQYCDFLGSVCSIWVTILCMARVADTVKYTLFMLGTLLIAMSMQLDRKGLWNMLGPILCAFLVMVTMWVYRGVRRKHCYPPSWRRWVFYLIPGALCALIGVCVYIFAETEDNYFYTHSLWHVLVATCVVFLLPPRDKKGGAVSWAEYCRLNWTWRRCWSWFGSPKICGYKLCPSKSDELHTVT